VRERVKARTRPSPRWSAFLGPAIPPSLARDVGRESSFALSCNATREIGGGEGEAWWRSIDRHQRAWRDFLPWLSTASPPADRRHPPFKPLANPGCSTCPLLTTLLTPSSSAVCSLGLSLSIPYPCIFLIFAAVGGIQRRDDETNVTGWMITTVFQTLRQSLFIERQSGIFFNDLFALGCVDLRNF